MRIGVAARWAVRDAYCTFRGLAMAAVAGLVWWPLSSWATAAGWEGEISGAATQWTWLAGFAGLLEGQRQASMLRWILARDAGSGYWLTATLLGARTFLLATAAWLGTALVDGVGPPALARAILGLLPGILLGALLTRRLRSWSSAALGTLLLGWILPAVISGFGAAGAGLAWTISAGASGADSPAASVGTPTWWALPILAILLWALDLAAARSGDF